MREHLIIERWLNKQLLLAPQTIQYEKVVLVSRGLLSPLIVTLGSIIVNPSEELIIEQLFI